MGFLVLRVRVFGLSLLTEERPIQLDTRTRKLILTIGVLAGLSDSKVAVPFAVVHPGAFAPLLLLRQPRVQFQWPCCFSKPSSFEGSVVSVLPQGYPPTLMSVY